MGFHFQDGMHKKVQASQAYSPELQERPKSTWVILDTTSINLAAKHCRTIRKPRHYTQLCLWPWPKGQYARGWTACASNHSRAQPEFPGSSACENPSPKGFSGVWCAPWIIFEAMPHDHMRQESAPWYWLHPALSLIACIIIQCGLSAVSMWSRTVHITPSSHPVTNHHGYAI